MERDIVVDDEEEAIDELLDQTGFNTQHEVETLKAMLDIASEIYKGYMPELSETKEAIKKSVNELCEFFKKFVSCL